MEPAFAGRQTACNIMLMSAKHLNDDFMIVMYLILEILRLLDNRFP